MTHSQTKAGFVSIVGRPNVGKSSLLNALVGEKLAIVSHKPQTTRTRIMGVVTQGQDQYVFLDTPGLHSAKNKLGHNMLKAVRGALVDVDVVLLVVDATATFAEAEQDLLAMIKKHGLSVILVLNKIDLCKDKSVLAQKMASYASLHDFVSIIPISVLLQDGISLVKQELQKTLKPSAHFFDANTLTDQPERVLVSERMREKILQYMQEEIPHGIAVVIEKMKERQDKNLLDIEATIYCEKKSHKGMIIGKQGAMLKKIATETRLDLERFFQIPVHLQCWVKVKEDWRNRDGLIENFGLSYKN